MSKLNFNRPNKNFYVEQFCKNTGASNWPPMDGAEPVVKNRVTDLILHEAKNVIKPQLEALKLTLPSHQIMMIAMNNVKSDADMTPADHYNNISNTVFSLIEQEVPNLLGQADYCDWSFVGDVI